MSGVQKAPLLRARCVDGARVPAADFTPGSLASVSTRMGDYSGEISPPDSALDSTLGLSRLSPGCSSKASPEAAEESETDWCSRRACAELAATRAVAGWVLGAELRRRMEAEAQAAKLSAALLALPDSSRPLLKNKEVQKKQPAPMSARVHGGKTNATAGGYRGSSRGGEKREAAAVSAAPTVVAVAVPMQRGRALRNDAPDDRRTKLEEWVRAGRPNGTRAGSASGRSDCGGCGSASGTAARGSGTLGCGSSLVAVAAPDDEEARHCGNSRGVSVSAVCTIRRRLDFDI